MAESFLGFDIPDTNTGAVDMSAFVSGPAVYGDFTPPQTIAPNDYGSADRGGIVALPPANDGPGLSVGGIISGATDLFKSALGAWQTVTNIGIQRDQLALNRDISRGDLAVRQAQTGSAADIAKIQASTAATVAGLQAQAEVAKATNAVKSATNEGTPLISLPSTGNPKTDRLIAVIGIGFTAAGLFYSMRKGRK